MRRFFTILSIASFLLCLMTCVLWVRSLRTYDQLVWTSSDIATDTKLQRSVWTLPGEIDFISTSRVPPNAPAPQWHFQRVVPRGRPAAWFWTQQSRYIGYDLKHNIAGLRWGIRQRTWQDPVSKVVFAHRRDAYAIPFWMVLVVTIVAPTLNIMMRVARRHRNRSGFCPACGYDIRATPDV